MADLCCAYTIAGLTLNNSTPGADYLLIGEDGVKGLDGAPIRSQVDPLTLSDGATVFTKRFGARIITFSGFCRIQSVEAAMNSTYYAALNALETSVVTALEGIRNSASTLAWTPNGQTAHSISVTYGVPGQEIEFGGSMLEKTFQFALIAANPTITVA